MLTTQNPKGRGVRYNKVIPLLAFLFIKHVLNQFVLCLGGMSILIDNTTYSGFNDLTNQSIEIGRNLFISKPEENCLEVSFPSSTSVKFCEKKGMLYFVVTPGDDYKNKTKGLMGTWNDNPNDDYTLPDGTVLPPSLTLMEIHFRFGDKCE